MTVPVNQLPPDQAIVNLLARNQLIMHIEQQLMQLQKLAEMSEETEEEKRERIKKIV